MRHELKILKPFADAIVSGDKTFEIRENDRGFNRGDLIHFYCVGDTETIWASEIDHPIRDNLYEISYVLSGMGIEEGYVAFAIRRYPS